jgi:thiol-disulfide isomerase/thioredoxin
VKITTAPREKPLFSLTSKELLMQKFNYVSRSLLIAGLTAAVALANAAEMGAPAPAFDLPGASGGVNLDFWASWCEPCKASFPWLNEMQAKYGAQGLQVVGVNVDAKQDDANRFLSETPAKFAVAFDRGGATPKSYGIKGMPSSVLIGADGKVLFEHKGFHAADKDKLEEQIKVALAGAKK